jgi:hypothetical protein
VMFTLVVALNYPFRGAVRVSPEPWLAYYETLAGKPAPCAVKGREP